jgi:hypothetical protein
MTKEKELPNRLSRKDFVKGAALGAGALAGASALAGCSSSTEPADTTTPCPTCAPAEERPVCESATPWLPEKWDYEADVVIVGYGGAGVTAAIAAHDAGAEVLVLEKAPTADGGNTGCALGSSNIPAPGQDAIDHIKALGWGTVTDDELIGGFVSAINDLPDWLESLGAELLRGPSAVIYATLPGGDAFREGMGMQIAADGGAGQGQHMFKFLSECADDRGINVMCASPAKELIQDPVTKEILGVKALTGGTPLGTTHWSREVPSHYSGGEEIYVKARKGVVLACGGFEANQDMMHQSGMSHSHSLVVPAMGTPYNTGDGIKMVSQIGAPLWHMNSSEVYTRCAKVPSEVYGVCVVLTDSDKCIWVNRYGKRFMNERIMMQYHLKETLPMFHFTGKVAPPYGPDAANYADYQNIPFYMVFDETLRAEGPVSVAAYGYNQVHQVYEWSEDNLAEIDEGWIIKADTIEELGSKIECKNFFGEVVGMDAAGLAETVDMYNQYCAAGEDSDFGRSQANLVPLNNPPFYALEMAIGNINTNGGPVHNKDAQTLDVDGRPIPRLYSPGEFGSIFGHLYFWGGNFPEALAFGRIAGENAAGEEPWT